MNITASCLILTVFICPLLSSEAHAQQSEILPENLVAHAIDEMERSLDLYYSLIDQAELAVFVEAVDHAARGRLLLEQWLEEDIDNYSFESAEQDGMRFSLMMIAAHARKFSGDVASR